MSTAITVRLTDEETELLAKFKSSMGIQTGSKVFLKILNQFPALQLALETTTDRLIATQNRLDSFERIARARQAAETELNNLLNNTEGKI